MVILRTYLTRFWYLVHFDLNKVQMIYRHEAIADHCVQEKLVSTIITGINGEDLPALHDVLQAADVAERIVKVTLQQSRDQDVLRKDEQKERWDLRALVNHEVEGDSLQDPNMHVTRYFSML